MGKLAPLASAIGPLAAFMGPAGQIVSAISTVSSMMGSKQKKSSAAPAAPPPFKPVKPAPVARPGSLAGMNGFDQTQERTAIATKGVSGGGLGKDEDSYYKNLVQRSLIGDNNQVSGSLNSLMPVESQYFSNNGVNTGDVNEFLRMIQGG